jgi:hypothetical protein
MNQNQQPDPAENSDSKAAKAEETMFGQTRAQLEQELVEEFGKDWVEAHKEMLDAQWDYIQSL